MSNTFLLSKRELQVFRLLAQGKTNNEVAAELSLSNQTIKNHVTNVLKGLEVRNKTEAFIALGWLEVPS